MIIYLYTFNILNSILQLRQNQIGKVLIFYLFINVMDITLHELNFGNIVTITIIYLFLIN